ncbi:MAG: hypothetical protein JW395_1861 [Nitrospira sp.]|nr:hypothetical protein [Nitrospira sp.]
MVVPETAVQTFIAIGQHDADDSELDSLVACVARLDRVNRLHWSSWNAVTDRMSNDDVLALFRGLIIVEKRLRWTGGSVSAAIWVFRALSDRNDPRTDSIADWALENSDNPWVPFGSSRGRARSLAEYRTQCLEKGERRAKNLAIATQADQAAAEWRSTRGPQRTLAAQQRRSPVRLSFLEQLSSLPIPAQLDQLARDVQYPVEWYPVSLAAAATTDSLANLTHAIRLLLIQKLKGRRRGPWATFKRRLREVSAVGND